MLICRKVGQPIHLWNVQEGQLRVCCTMHVAQKAGMIAAKNLEIAQHQDTLEICHHQG